MTSSRALLSLLILTGTTAAGLVACGDDDAGSGSTNVTDAGHVDATVATDAGDAGFDAGAVQAAAANVAVYVGAAVKLDGTASSGPTGFTYAWSVTTTPAASAVTTASLTDATTATPGFQPDLPGTYVLSLTVASGGVTSTVPVTVTVVDPTIVYLDTENDAGAWTSGLKAAGATTGDGGVRIGCEVSDAGVSNTTIASYSGQFGSDIWEGPAGTPSRIVYAFDVVPTDGGTSVTSALYATTTAATCATRPVVLDSFPGGSYQSRPYEQPRFSPSGNRIAYVRNLAAGSTVSTVGFDGTQARDLGAFYAYGDGGPNPTQTTAHSGATVRPIWIDESNVAWLEATTGGWQIVSASDVAEATPKLLLSCTGNVPSQFDLLPSGELLVSQSVAAPASTSYNENLYAYLPNATTKACGTGRAVTNLAGGGSYARDFVLSPDRTRVAFVAYDQTARTFATVITGVDGTGTVTLPSSNGIGPRWSGGGRFVSYAANTKALFDAGTSGIAVALADGGSLHPVATPAGSEVTYGIGNGYAHFCAMGRGYGSGVMFVGMLGILGLRIARRRRA